MGNDTVDTFSMIIVSPDSPFAGHSDEGIASAKHAVPIGFPMRTMVRRLLVGVVLLSVCAVEDARAADAETADVLSAVRSLEAELEVVRAYLGSSKPELREFRVDTAAPRHSFFLAQRVFSKLSLLVQERVGGATQSLPVAPDREISNADTLGVMRQAADQLRYIKSAYKIERIPERVTTPDRADDADVVEAMVRALRQINLMLTRRYKPSDVYERLDLATVYVAGVLKTNSEALYPSVEFVPYKQPVDVFRKLLDCVALNIEIAQRAGVEVMEIDVRRMRMSDTRLSNNHDLATILLSDIAEWTLALDGADDVFPEETLLPHIVPSHVFQKASQLEAQLQAVLANLNA